MVVTAAIAVVIRRSLVIAIVMVVMIAALVCVLLALRLEVDMVHREYATPEPGDHAEHQQPWEPTAHDAQETVEFLFCKPKAVIDPVLKRFGQALHRKRLPG
jgi:hypothetical protein